jgi:Diaminopimelate decarboxylase
MLGGVDVRDLAQEFGTPLFVLDEGDVRSRARAFREAYADAGASWVFYAAKAFLSVAVARWVHEEGLGIDVASGGELAVAMRAGVPGEALLMHGNNKSMQELVTAVEYGVGRIVIDSFEEIARVAEAAAQAGVEQQVMVRATVGVEAHTHEYIATAHEDQKFGLSASGGAVEEAVRRIAKLPSLTLVGLHSHFGSQIFDAAGLRGGRGSGGGASAADLPRARYRDRGTSTLGGGMGYRPILDSDDPLDVLGYGRGRSATSWPKACR